MEATGRAGVGAGVGYAWLMLASAGARRSPFMLALAPSVAFLFLARILDGITGGNIIVAQAYITDITPRERRTESLGYILAVFGLGFIFGPALGGALSAAFGPRVPYVIAGLAAVLVVALGGRLLGRATRRKEDYYD